MLLIGNIYQFSSNRSLKNQIAETTVTIESLNEQLAEKDNIIEETQKETEEQETLISDLQSQIEALELAAEEEYTLTEMNKEMLVTQNSATYETPNPYTKVSEVQQDEIVKVIGAVGGSDWYQIEQSDGTVSFIDGIYLKEIEQSQEEQEEVEQSQTEQQQAVNQTGQQQQAESQQNQQETEQPQQSQTSQTQTDQSQTQTQQSQSQQSGSGGLQSLGDGSVLLEDGTVIHPGDDLGGGVIFGADGDAYGL